MMAKGKVVTDKDPLRPDLPEKNTIKKILRAQSGKLPREFLDDNFLDAGL
ncbi:MAG: hypothetical protein HY542_02740 [Deltaproteobacteria bacterium]|nr:hypothetical protein [Deltaproteobacteria bacterium]